MENTLKRTDYYIKEIFRKYLLASILAMLSTSFAGLVDTVIVGHYLGETGLSAMALISPVYLIYYTVGAVVGIGGSIAGALAVGKNDYDKYRNIFSLSTVILLILGIVITLSGLIFSNRLVAFFGGEGLIGQYTAEYLEWYIILGIFTLLVYPPLYFLKVDGRPQISSYLFLLSGVLNVIFSWLFMSPVCKMGIKGASIATGLSMGITSATGFYILIKGSKELKLIRCKMSDIKDIIRLGIPNGLNNLLNALKTFSINKVIIGIGAISCLSSFTLIKNVSELVCGVIIGISAALMPIVGIFSGEKDNDSIRRVCKSALISGMLLTAVLAILSGCFPKIWCMLFNVSDSASMDAVKSGLICLALSLIPGFFNLMFIGYFNTVKRTGLSNLILILRLGLYIIPAAYILGKVKGITGVYAALILADALTLITVMLVVFLIRQKNPELDIYMLDTSDEGSGEIAFSVKNTVDDVVDASAKITDFCEQNEIDIKRTMQISLCLEEMLTVIITYCMDKTREQFIDIRVVKTGEGVMIRIRNTGKIFDPIRFYEENKDNEDMMEQVLGIKMIVNSARNINFHETFGTNSLMVQF